MIQDSINNHVRRHLASPFSNLYSDLPFLPERKKVKKCKKLVCNIHNKENYVVHIRALNQTLNHGLIMKNVHKVIQFN